MNIKLLEIALEQERRMLVHFDALRQLFGDTPVSLEDFAKQYPRTHNALVTNKPYSFDLPNSDI